VVGGWLYQFKHKETQEREKEWSAKEATQIKTGRESIKPAKTVKTESLFMIELLPKPQGKCKDSKREF